MMRLVQGMVVASLLAKLAVLGGWSVGFLGPDAASAALPAEAAEPPPGGAHGPTAGLPPELLEQSQGFREVLEQVRKRQQELEAREQALVAREAGLQQLEKQVASEVTRLETLTGGKPATPEPAAAKKPGARPAAGAKPAEGEPPAITKIYESMKPDEAGPILDKMDDATLRAIFSSMKEKQIGAILAAMKADKAVALTKLLAGTADATPPPAAPALPPGTLTNAPSGAPPRPEPHREASAQHAAPPPAGAAQAATAPPLAAAQPTARN